MLNAVIFDFDGVIIDSESLHFKVFNEVLSTYDIEISWEDYQGLYIGYDDEKTIKTVFKKNRKILNKKIVRKLIQQKAHIFEKAVSDKQAKIFPGAIELIKSIPIRVPIGLCTGALRSDIKPVLSGLKIKNTFKAIVTAEDTKKSKPHPDPYNLILSQLDIHDPNTVVAIEDTPAGIRSAKSAGLKVLAVTNTFSSQFLFDADAVTDTLERVNRKTLEDLIL